MQGLLTKATSLSFPTPQGVLEQLADRFIDLGFNQIRQRGSHVFFENDSGLTTVVPNHPGEEIGRGLIRKIAKDIGKDLDEFLKDI